MTELSRQQLKERRRVQDALLFPPPPRMVRLGKSRPRAGLPNQEPMGSDLRYAHYLRRFPHWPHAWPSLTPRQRRRIDHKAHRAIAVAERETR